MNLKSQTALMCANLIVMVLLVGVVLYYVRARQNDDIRLFMGVNKNLAAITNRLEVIDKKLDKALSQTGKTTETAN